MRKLILTGTGLITLASLLFILLFSSKEPNEENEYETLRERYDQEFERLKDPDLGYIPVDRIINANNYTINQKRAAFLSRTTSLNWQERGPVYDVVGLSNGNTRGGSGNNYTAGIVQTFLTDANDASGNTVFAGSPSGGLWRCTNFLSTSAPNWVAVNDFQANLAIASICQDPSQPNIMYIATGDANTRSIRGYGIWKSTNGGLNWSLLPGTTNYYQSFKILCDNSGNVYVATGGSGLIRSTNGGTTWSSIGPSSSTLVGVSNPSYVPDMEFSSTGRLHVIFGYYGSKCQHVYTDNPGTVSSTTWNFSSGIRTSSTSCSRIELATQGNILYAVTANSSNNVDSCYRSSDGGATWTKQNTNAYTSGLGSGQTWYALTLQINPDNANEFIVGGLDAFRSTDGGATISKITYWVGSAPYVHADHHCMQWYKSGTESRVMIGCDGGVFLSTDGGVSWTERNQNLGIKQFFSCAIDPTSGVNSIMAGAQDNGCHLLKQAGLSWSTEVTGGDGSFVYIGQQNPQIMFGSYLYNQYRRSTNGGQTWSSLNISSSAGQWTNPYDYDDNLNILYGSYTANNIMRLPNASTVTTTGGTVSSSNYNVVPVTLLNGSIASAIKVSPFTPDRLYVGSTSGKLLRIDNASTATPTITNIAGPSFAGNLMCIALGTSDNTIVAIFSNYGINNVWYTNDGGTTWTGIDNNLPDMPVWSAVFEPGTNDKLLLGTETGVFAGTVNGTSTVWTAEANFPTVQTRMLKVRSSDGTVVAATFGRGIWTASINSTCTAPAIITQPVAVSSCNGGNAVFQVAASGTNLSYQWRKAGVPINGATGATLTLNNVSTNDVASYDVVITGGCGSATSNTASLTLAAPVSITTQPIAQSTCAGNAASFSVAASNATSYQWRKNGNNINGANTATLNLTNVSAADVAAYDVIVTNGCGSVTSSAVNLSLNNATTIQSQPAGQIVCAGTAANFAVTATGTGTLSYQWRKSGSNINGATSATYTIANAGSNDAGSYDVIVTGSCGSITSNAVTLVVNPSVSITSQPTAQAVCSGGNATFSITAANATGFQWRKNGTNISGATNATLNLTNVTAGDVATYDVVVTGSCGTATSTGASLSLNIGTNILSQPVAQSVCSGTGATFGVTATGAGILLYQWRKNGTAINGATSASYTIANTTTADAGNYDVVITGACSNVTSTPVPLVVNTCTSIPQVNSGITDVSLLPNVFSMNTLLQVKSTYASKINWQIIDSKGRIVLRFTQTVILGNNQLPLQLSNLASGVYYLSGVSEKGKLTTVRMIKI